MSVRRVDITEAAQRLVERLKAVHGDLMFHQSGGCCDGSSPMCFPAGEFKIGQSDRFLGVIAGCRFYMGEQQFEYWKHTHLLIDIVPGRGGGFSLEAPEGVRFIVRSRVFSDDELRQLAAQGDPPCGD